MSPRHEVVERKLLALAGYVDELRPKVRLGLARYRRSGTLRRAVERLLQLVVESAADACAALVVASGRPAAESMRGQFTAAMEIGAVPADLAARLMAAAGLRNRLVHDYEAVDDVMVWQAAQAALADLPRFIAAVTAYLAGPAGDDPPG